MQKKNLKTTKPGKRFSDGIPGQITVIMLNRMERNRSTILSLNLMINSLFFAKNYWIAAALL